jgi:hypothetical protein
MDEFSTIQSVDRGSIPFKSLNAKNNSLLRTRGKNEEKSDVYSLNGRPERDVLVSNILKAKNKQIF